VVSLLDNQSAMSKNQLAEHGCRTAYSPHSAGSHREVGVPEMFSAHVRPETRHSMTVVASQTMNVSRPGRYIAPENCKNHNLCMPDVLAYSLLR